METITRDVKDISSPARQAIEDFLGHPLNDNERLVIQVVGQETGKQPQTGAGLPEWCNVFAGLSEAVTATTAAESARNTQRLTFLRQ